MPGNRIGIIPHFAIFISPICASLFSAGRFFYLARGMLFERDHICDELDRLAAAAAAGQGHVAFIVGEAGIGKTSVLRATAARIGGRMRLLWAACEDLSAAEALTLLRDMPIVDADALDRADDSGSRLALFGDTLARLAAIPTMLLIEDLHWADDGSIDFIRYVGRRIADLPVLLIVSSRTEDQGARGRLARAANDLPPASRRRFELDRLSSVAVGKLAAAHGLIGSAIYTVTGGNPLLVTELLAAGGHRSRSIDDVVVARADRLDPAARAFLDHCAIIPRRISIDRIEAAGVAEDAVRACIEAGLLLPDGDGLAFRHEITRHAIEDALSPLKRRHLHAAELDRLDRVGGSAARRLHHAIGAGDMARIRSLAPQAAANASALGAHREAARAWSAILNDGEAPADPGQCAQYAFELHVTGDISGAIRWQEQALAMHAAADDGLRQGDGLRFLSRLHYLNGHRARADQAGEQAVALLETHPGTPELALAYANLAHLAMLAEHGAEAVRWSERAIPIAEALGRDDILATLLNNHGTAIQYAEPDRGLDLLDRAISLGVKSGSQEHVARAFTNKGWVLMQGRRLEEALATLREGIAYCVERDLDTWRDYMTGGHALALTKMGRWDEAEAAAAPVAADPHNTHLMRNPAVRALALLRIRRGDPGADALIEELRAHMAKGREAPRFIGMALIVAERAWTAGDAPGEALSLLDEAAALARVDGCPWDRAALWFWRDKLQGGVAPPDRLPPPYVRLAAGDMAGSAQAFADIGLPFDQALALAEGDETQATRGVAMLERLGAVATAARIRLDLGDRGLRRGTRGPRASTRANSFGLTRREIDVLRAIDRGLTNKEIGERLFVSAKTIDHHVSSILGKFGARTRGEAAALARAQGMID